MQVLLSIGDFSRMTYLSVKALRHYHEIGLLEPAEVNPRSGYRRYDARQVPPAQVIRRLRDLGMPLDDVRVVLQAPDVESRNKAIVAHLARMERSLQQTQGTVASLRALLEHPKVVPISLEFRSIPKVAVVAIQERVAMSSLEDWWLDAISDLHRVVTTTGVRRAGPDGALFFNEFFESESGEIVVFVPVGGRRKTVGRIGPLDIPAGEFAVAVHEGSVRDLDQTYGALGTFVAERAIGVKGPIREHYLVGQTDTADEAQHRTEVCWPVFQTVTVG